MKKSLIIILLVCFAFMLAGPPSLMADNSKTVKPQPAKSKTSTALHKNHKALTKPVEPVRKISFQFGFKFSIPWIPVILPFNPGISGGDDNRCESSIDRDSWDRIRNMTMDNGDDTGWEDHDK